MSEAIQEISTERCNATGQYVKDDFWKKMSQASKQASHEATKICLAFSASPFPDAACCKLLFAALEAPCLALASVLCSLPNTEGRTMRKELVSAIRDIFRSVLGLISGIQNAQPDSKTLQQQRTGGVWECCERIEKLPQDNSAAVLHIVSTSSSLVSDAHRELQEVIENASDDSGSENSGLCAGDDEQEDAWKSGERDIAITSLGLVKAACCCMKKATEVVSANGTMASIQTSDLDNIAIAAEAVSPAVDDFVVCVYPPMRKRMVMEMAANVVQCLKSLLSMISVDTEETPAWMEVLMNAIGHNLTKVENLTGKSRLG